MDGLLGGPKDMLPPPSKIIGGGESASPSLPLPMLCVAFQGLFMMTFTYPYPAVGFLLFDVVLSCLMMFEIFGKNQSQKLAFYCAISQSDK